MIAFLTVRGLTKKFGDNIAVDNIDFEVKRGICFGLLGPNGAGKTTTIEMLEGMLSADKGEMLYNGSPLNSDIRGRIGIQFQHTAIQDYLTTRETLQLFRAMYPQPLGIDTLMDMCDLHDFADNDHRKLSGGQKQRLLLALALVNDPELLFLDEPTTGLDPHARRKFWALIEQIKRQGKTIILTTHYMDEAEQLCDEIVIMNKGNIIERGEPKRLLASHFPGVLIRLPMQSVSSDVFETLNMKSIGGFLELTTLSVAEAVNVLVTGGVNLDGMQAKSANLDDLFLKLTGHGLGEQHG